MKRNTREIIEAYTLLKNGKITKMDDADKFKLIKALRPMKKINEEFDSFRTDVMEKLKGDNHDEMIERAQKWQQEGEKTTLSEQERIEINSYFTEYNEKVTNCLKEEIEKEHELDDIKLTDDAISKLIASNDWTLGQVESVMDMLC